MRYRIAREILARRREACALRVCSSRRFLWMSRRRPELREPLYIRAKANSRRSTRLLNFEHIQGGFCLSGLNSEWQLMPLSAIEIIEWPGYLPPRPCTEAGRFTRRKLLRGWQPWKRSDLTSLASIFRRTYLYKIDSLALIGS